MVEGTLLVPLVYFAWRYASILSTPSILSTLHYKKEILHTIISKKR
jgi:hypothetical protein